MRAEISTVTAQNGEGVLRLFSKRGKQIKNDFLVSLPCPDNSLFPWGKRLDYICYTTDSCWRNAFQAS